MASAKVQEPMATAADVVIETNLKKREMPIEKVVVHPLVLLSVVDHFNRMGKIGNQKRVVGLLLGSIRSKGVLDISNSFAGQSPSPPAPPLILLSLSPSPSSVCSSVRRCSSCLFLMY